MLESVMNNIRRSKIDLIFGLGFLISFLGGCTTKLIYEFRNEPDWLNSVVVAMFVGLGACFGSLMGVTSIIIYKSKIDSFDKKIKAIVSLLIAVPVFFVGLFVLWVALENFLRLL